MSAQENKPVSVRLNAARLAAFQEAYPGFSQPEILNFALDNLWGQLEAGAKLVNRGNGLELIRGDLLISPISTTPSAQTTTAALAATLREHAKRGIRNGKTKAL